MSLEYENNNQAAPIDALGDAQNMAERLARQFGAGEATDQLAKMREILLATDDEDQSSLALYICGYPDETFEALSTQPLAAVVSRLDQHTPPATTVETNAGLEQGVERFVASKTPQTSTTRRKIGGRAVTSSEQTIGDRDLESLYVEGIGKVPLLDAEMEVELSKRIEAGLYAASLLEQGETELATIDELEWFVEDGKRARNHFIEANLRLVVSIAKKHTRSCGNMDLIDLISEGNQGLIRAVEKFDYTKGFKFSTYATWWIRQSIGRGIMDAARVVRLPRAVLEDINRVTGAERELETTLGRAPRIEELAEETGLDPKRINDLLEWKKESMSLDQPIDGTETPLGDLLGDSKAVSADDEYIPHEQRQPLLQFINNTLDDRSADIILSRFGFNGDSIETLASIGKRYGISAERVRQLERFAKDKLRRNAGSLADYLA